MTTWEWIAIAAMVVVFVLLAIVIVVRVRRRRSRLSETFGTEYERAVASSGARAAERQLSAVEQEHEELQLRELSGAARERYADEWRQAELRFVSDPSEAVTSADGVVTRLLADRGYPGSSPAEGAPQHVAIDHPYAFERYRDARTWAGGAAQGPDRTERLRRAFLDYRAAFEDLLGEERSAA